MIKVKATDASFYYKKKLAEFGRIVYPGEVFEVTEARFNVLNGENKYGLKFVEKIEEPEVEIKPTKATKKKEAPAVEQEPEIFVVNPGEEPVAVDEELKPVKKKKTKKATSSEE